MHIKWKIYLLTFLTYGIIHSIRVSWISLKPMLVQVPYGFSLQFLAIVDMCILFALALSLQLFGSKTQKVGPKKFLLIGMVLLFTVVAVTFILLIKQVNAQAIYLIMFILIGCFTCVGWPSCLYMISQYFSKKNIVLLSIWNGTMQFGNLIAIFTTYILIGKVDGGSYSFLVIGLLLLLMIIIDAIFLPKPVITKHGGEIGSSPHLEFADERQGGKDGVHTGLKDGHADLKDDRAERVSSSESQENANNDNTDTTDNVVTFLNVWLIPGVALYVFSAGIIKAVNTIIVNWLVFYLILIGMVREARLIAICWSISTFAGGIIGALINPHVFKKIFLICLLICSGLFVFMEEMHLRPNDFEMVLAIIVCGLLYGGPFNLMSTTVPIMLSDRPDIKARRRAKPVIISTMEGFTHLIGGISVVLIPNIGVLDLHYMASFYCLVGAMLMGIQILRSWKDGSVKDDLQSDLCPDGEKPCIKPLDSKIMGKEPDELNEETFKIDQLENMREAVNGNTPSEKAKEDNDGQELFS